MEHKNTEGYLNIFVGRPGSGASRCIVSIYIPGFNYKATPNCKGVGNMLRLTVKGQGMVNQLKSQ